MPTSPAPAPPATTLPATTLPATTLPVPAIPTAPHGPALGALLTVSEVAAYLRVSEMTVYRLISNRQIGATRIGRGYRIPTADLARYLDAGRTARAS